MSYRSFITRSSLDQWAQHTFCDLQHVKTEVCNLYTTSLAKRNCENIDYFLYRIEICLHLCVSQRGEVDCWLISCAPVADCEFTVVPEGECCPRCVTDPCLADTVQNDITKTCVDEYGITRFSGSAWTKHGTECSLCQCKVLNTYVTTHRHTCCKSPRSSTLFIIEYLVFLSWILSHKTKAASTGPLRVSWTSG